MVTHLKQSAVNYFDCRPLSLTSSSSARRPHSLPNGFWLQEVSNDDQNQKTFDRWFPDGVKTQTRARPIN